jgi:hypothetical protein
MIFGAKLSDFSVNHFFLTLNAPPSAVALQACSNMLSLDITKNNYLGKIFLDLND